MKKNSSTFCIHPLHETHREGSGITTPIFPSTSYAFIDDNELIYPGFFTTQNQIRLAKIMTEHESGEWGLVVNSGMSAIMIALMSFLKSGDHVILSGELYGGTTRLVSEELIKFGISYSVAGETVDTFKAALRNETRVIYLETPSNPYLSILPLDEIAALARERSIITIVDNTVATSINQRPLELGIDISVQSGTKYMGGHNDLQFGTLVCKDKAMATEILRAAKLFGAGLSPETCYQAERSLKTLALRMERHNENGMVVAEALTKHDLIGSVYYPGLKTHRYHDVAKRQMDGFSGLLSFEVKANADSDLFLKSLKVVAPALSFGGLESVICIPAKTSHRGLSNERMDKLIRLSVGLEHPDDIVSDVSNALQIAVRSTR